MAKTLLVALLTASALMVGCEHEEPTAAPPKASAPTGSIASGGSSSVDYGYGSLTIATRHEAYLLQCTRCGAMFKENEPHLCPVGEHHAFQASMLAYICSDCGKLKPVYPVCECKK